MSKSEFGKMVFGGRVDRAQIIICQAHSRMLYFYKNIRLLVKNVKRDPMYYKGFLTGFICSCGISICSVGILFTNIDWNEFISKIKAKNVFKYGLPIHPPLILTYNNHVLAYDASRKIPYWVAEVLTKDSMKGKAKRDDSKFKPDPRIPDYFAATNEDYKRSGYSRGHMSAAANHKKNQKNMDDTFYLTNIVPQDFNNNAKFWNKFEMFCRDLVKEYQEIRVITGPIFLPNVYEGNKKFIKYEVIGPNNVAVPTHLFKIIFAENKNNGEIHHAAFIVPNQPIPEENELIDYLLPVQKIEKSIGYKFLDDKLMKSSTLFDLCQKVVCRLRKPQHN